MLEASDTARLDNAPQADALGSMHARIERLESELKYKQTKVEALNFEIARRTTREPYLPRPCR